ncbi:MAG: prepilin-type N-terminal cleavage/methylation domain-containing protein [Nitrospirae bacterium]|nr:prepilin-type N-terminal cleavage/methylation domain-containing protein [Nitrospirota bacterium]
MLSLICQAGFTLIEMMVVVSIIAILAAVGIPKFMKSMDSAKSSEAVTAVGRIADALKEYRDIHGQYPSNMLGSTVVEDYTTSGSNSGQRGISSDLPTLDISGSVNWSYQVQASSNTASEQLCITATAVNVSTSANGRAIYYIQDVSAVPAQYVSKLDGHFYKAPLFNASATDVAAIFTGVSCPNPQT